MDGIHIRPYVPDQDDETMLEIENAAVADAPDFVPGTMEQVRVERKSPNWTPEGKFLAEVDG